MHAHALAVKVLEEIEIQKVGRNPIILPARLLGPDIAAEELTRSIEKILALGRCHVVLHAGSLYEGSM